MKLTKELLCEHIEYRDGDLFWKKTTPRSYSVKVGEKIGNPTSTGRLCFRFFGFNLQNHRAIFMMHHGFLPPVVDHIDGNFLNNKISNLREANKIQNGQNSKTPKSNSSGVKGVDIHNNKYRVRVVSCGKSIYVGSFKSLEEAKNAAHKARKDHHKEFARHE